MPASFPVLRFVVAHPERLSEREVGERRIASQLDQAIDPERMGKLSHLRLSALIAPDNGGADDLVLLIQQNSAVHLAGEADASDIIFADAGLLQYVAYRELAGLPPVLRILVGPGGVGT